MSQNLPPDEEQRLLNTHWAGHAAACERAAAIARQKAGEAFGYNQDERAKFWREVAEWLDGLGKQHRNEQKKYWSKEIVKALGK